MARIVINERTGTIVMGKDVQIAPVAVMHGDAVGRSNHPVRCFPTGAIFVRNYANCAESQCRRKGRAGART